ncbi:MBL fold metallo-hydrolase [Gracilibacillus massiliensis]|uniref:MBL fold metallo-hydrolase n=1 Tax=Gracilibacillus massiliensis TaxID=1564956 RepID=UPI00071DA067|nr:MBL fold metallo-hydrolase [Gracilibacillus massiliensis]
MEIEFLGTAGAMTTPRPLCSCDVCKEAREKGVPFSRLGPSIFVHGPNLLIDTPEEITVQINRSSVDQIQGILYSHWHPDHVMGIRVIESITADWIHYPEHPEAINVYLPEQVKKDFATYIGTDKHLTHLERQGYARVVQLQDDDRISVEEVTIQPIRLAEEYVYAYLLDNGSKKVLIAMDELNNWQPSEQLKNIDIAILPTGVFEYHPISGERKIQADHPVLEEEATFEETIHIIDQLKAKKVILTHIEEAAQLGYLDLKEIATYYNNKGYNLEFAYDTYKINV